MTPGQVSKQVAVVMTTASEDLPGAHMKGATASIWPPARQGSGCLPRCPRTDSLVPHFLFARAYIAPFLNSLQSPAFG